MQETLEPGAHLTSPRRGYLHHGIYVGAGRVIHYGGFNRPFHRGPIEEVTLEAFANGRPLRVQAWAAPAYAGQAVVRRARARLGEDRYSFWSNNCEHFAQWCVTGTSRSAQVDAWVQWLSGAFAGLGSLLAPRRSAAPRAS
jgi:HRAS-like suppressor 3